MKTRQVRPALRFLLAALALPMLVSACGREGSDPAPDRDEAPRGDRATEIVDRMIAAHGGLEAWRRIRDVHFRERRVRFANEERPETTSERDIYMKRRNGDWMVRIEVAAGGRLEQIGPDGLPADGFIVTEPIVMVYDGEEYLETRGGRRVTDPEILRSTRFIVAAWRYWFGIPFVIKDPGVNLAYEGEEILYGQPVHAIEGTFAEGVVDNPDDVFRYYINKETHMVESLRYRMQGRPRFREFRMQKYVQMDGILHDTLRQYQTHEGVNDGFKEMDILAVNSDLDADLFRLAVPTPEVRRLRRAGS